MNSLLITELTGHSEQTAAGKQWQELRRLWNDIEKKQARNQRYDDKITRFYDAFKQQAEEAEQQVCVATEQWITHLIQFIPRKSIKGYLRDTLYEWIEEEISILEANPFRQFSTDPIREKFHQSLVDISSKTEAFEPSRSELDACREELSEMLGEAVPFSDEELTEMINNPEVLMDYLHRFQQQAYAGEDSEQGFYQEDAGDFDSDDFHEYHKYDGGSFDERQGSSEAGLAFFQHKEISKLYRQLAKRFHPDKELDPEKKQHKKELMQQLSQAKKEKDTFTMLMLAQTWLPDCEITLDDAALKGCEAALKSKITMLNQQYQQLRYESGLKGEIWLRFGGGNKASREKGIREYVAGLEGEKHLLQARLSDLKTVKDIQAALRERSNQFNPFGFADNALMPDGFEDFFEQMFNGR